MKPIWASRTFWVNAVSVLAGILTMFGLSFLNVEVQGEVVAIIMGIVNIALRFITGTPVSLTKPK